ncbi:AAEL002706-PA [Aedes aegypti]|uniref:AAEL002706-PA n=1 Tax=Aedes aegypti TaxID=7159 RepID=Q17HC9_AEDAE|nr:AAEL002706-PA [Aedes aegypti]
MPIDIVRLTWTETDGPARSTTVAVAIAGEDPRNVNGDDHHEVAVLRIDVERPRKNTATNGNANRIVIVNVTEIGIENVIVIAIGSAIATEGVGIVPVRTAPVDPDLIRDLIADHPQQSVESLRKGVRGAPTESVVRKADRSRSTTEDTVNTARTDERNVAMNIVASIVTTEKDHPDTTLIIKGT